ncbi:MAG: hypothetical protein M3Y41_10780, partial [Pseudomonadota bacterium]|nr:hypothetical protein [Pseudomonadota bacterium]
MTSTTKTLSDVLCTVVCDARISAGRRPELLLAEYARRVAPPSLVGQRGAGRDAAHGVVFSWRGAGSPGISS